MISFEGGDDLLPRGNVSRLGVSSLDDIQCNRWESAFISSWKILAAKIIDLAIPIVGLRLDPSKDVALVTGGSGGLGRQLVSELHKKRIITVILDIVPPSGLEKCSNIHFYPCDISAPKIIADVHQKILREVGQVTILINNAAITSDHTLESVDNDRIEKIIHVNLLGAYSLIREFVPSMLEVERGYIVNIASVLGFVSPARLTAYGASKGGLIALHESLIAELEQHMLINIVNPAYPPLVRRRGTIRSLLVCPGKIDTKMFDNAQSPSKIIAPDLDPEYLAKEIVKAIENNRSGTLKLPYYTNMMSYFKALDWPWFTLFRVKSGVDTIISERPEAATPEE
ncbi:HCL087Wp [Eremothecium sinecaudum]|uniref:HCL087Wp n=1 Tax=Eremothecium sinecaudum TaxID=45286 RepID=A0A0X8HRF5_9SACH|nr:HCL087Wp [Eremothecium sinecaudum]AMD20064.1 HCL087Wp [Eremothecium sinecaudum]